ncbi:glucoamylase family protein [Peloplasma aerotolerans]|uniref:Glucoamylase family protein n=1 Tax=Peloplasma aerotolerans TaxID=3044389 RepID=A0AAW6U2T8_9MOLU|nr:glucoamylase family protein [Mariniplasma sp. M4Ah]MDI6452288.1 glucoamylase family protein [Mariniplasma sp. M4Ah]
MKNISLKEIQKTAFDYFMNYTNFNPESKGFGLTVDATHKLQKASIAATGFMLSSLVIGVENNYISRHDAYEKALMTLKTLVNHVDHKFGFFAHFLDIETGDRYHKCEYSTIDTALCLCGVLTVDAYFQDEEIAQLSTIIFDRIDWEILFHQYENVPVLYMSYNPDKDGDYVDKKPGFIHQWDMFAEQLMMYVMIGASKYSHHAKALYEGFERIKGKYQNFEYIHSPGNALFVYQFPMAWLDLKEVVDQNGINWFENAKNATLAHQACSIFYQHRFRTHNQYFFGFTASDTPKGYRVFGALPNRMNRIDSDGTVAPYGCVGSIIFTPDICKASIKEMGKIKGLWGPYGFYDAFNLEHNQLWISDHYISIDKGLEMLMINAYLTQDVYKAFMSHQSIQIGMEVIGWKRK